MMIIAVAALAVAVSGCMLMLMAIYVQGDRMGRALEIQMQGLGETYRLGFEALTISLERQARISPADVRDEIERVGQAMLRMGASEPLKPALPIAALCALRGPVLWAQMTEVRAKLAEMIERERQVHS